MTGPAATNRDLATRARERADTEPHGSLPRKAFLCAAVALDGAKTLAGARRVLGEVRPDDVQRAARLALDELIREDT